MCDLVVALAGSFAVVILMVVIAVWYGQKRPAGKPVTWGEAMVGAVLVFGGLFFAYSFVPEAWILYSGNELKWRPDQYLTGSQGTLIKGPIKFSKAGLGDLITVLIYGLMLNLHIGLFIYWNKRGAIQEKKQRTKEAQGARKGGLLSRKGQLT